MTVAVALAMMAAALAVYVAALSRRFALAPGWQDQRWFSLGSLAVAGFSACNIPIVTFTATPVVILFARLQMTFAALHVACWIRYTDAFLRTRTRLDRACAWTALALAALSLVPGVVYRDAYEVRTFEPLHAVYHDPVTTWFGDAALAIVVGLFAPLALRYWRALRAGTPHAGTHLGALAALVALAMNDALVAAGLVTMPYLLDLAFVVPIGVVGYILTARFAADARALAELRGRLESIVNARTAELAYAHQKLSSAEKLAALGQFAAGVAHEVNNPAAVVAANLEYLEERLGEGTPPPDALECVRDARSATQRIARIVRQLLDAGRLAASRVETESVSVAAAASEALRIAEARCPPGVRLVDRVPPALHVRAQENMLVQVLVNLLVNGAQAVPEGREGEVVVSAARDGSRVRLSVADDGAGMPPEVLNRVFEPFFSTKPLGVGTGLGLAVSRGLIASQGGDLALASELGHGTVATVTLPATDAPARAARETPSAAEQRRRRLLLVDDDAALLASLRRRLEPRFDVETATGVDDALPRAADPTFDVVVCDVMMPVGGGERLYRELAARAPARAGHVAFLTGGAANEAARAFLASQAQPVLQKPLDLAALEAVADRLAGARSSAAA